MIEYEALLRLQDIDLQLMRYSRQLKAMPQQKKIAALDAAKRKLAGQLTKIVGQRKDAEIDVADSEAVHQDISCFHMLRHRCPFFVHLQHITAFQDKNILLRDSQLPCDIFVCFQMPVFTVYRNCIFRLYQ